MDIIEIQLEDIACSIVINSLVSIHDSPMVI